ncbi:MAG: hypothetical protein ACK47F_09735 [Flavobacteriales bacterium]
MKTAVGFLIDIWVKNGTLKGEDMFQATQMEKEQIIDAYYHGVCNEDITAGQYYNETFKNGSNETE